MASILVVDDELGIRGLLSEILGDEGHSVELAENAAQARAARERSAPDLVLLDIWMPDVDGITLLKEWSAAGLLTMPVIMMSGHGTIDTAVEATKHGAMAFLEKPITLQKLLRSVELGLQRNAPRPAPAAAVPSGWSRPEPEPTPYTTVPLNGVVTHSLSPTPSGPSPDQVFHLDRPLREARDAFERSYFEFHLAKEGGSMTRVAEKTGLERTHLYRKLKQLGVDISRAKRGG
jgi:DNA-binding NtrC family response regulator